MFFFQTVSLRSFWISLSANKSLEAKIAARLSIMFHTCSLSKLFPETDSCISLASLSSDWFCLKTSYQGLCLVLSLETELTEVFLEYIEFWFLSKFPTFLQSLTLCIFNQCDNQHNLFATKSLLKNLTANGFYFMNWKTKWLKVLKLKQSSAGSH